MIENKTVFSYVLPSTGNLVEYRGLETSYGTYELDALDAAVLVRLGTSSGSFPSSQAALEVYDTSGTKYLINGWPGSQANNLNFVGADGLQYYLSNRLLNTGTAIPSYGNVKVNYRCILTYNYVSQYVVHRTLSWEWYTGNTIQPVLQTVYNQTGVEYRVRFGLNYLKKDTYHGYTFYVTRNTSNNTWIQYDSVSQTNNTDNLPSSSNVYWYINPILQRNVNGTWKDVGGFHIQNYSTVSSVTSGTIGPINFNTTATYYGANMGSSGADIHLTVYDT